MLRFTTKSRYALRLMLDLAINPRDLFISLRDVSSRQEISVKYLEQIVMQLVRAGLIQSSRGPLGGYKLTRPPAEYTPGDILRAIEGDLSIVGCLDSPCHRVGCCYARAFWKGLNRTLNDHVDGVTLDEMIRAGRLHGPADYSI